MIEKSYSNEELNRIEQGRIYFEQFMEGLVDEVKPNQDEMEQIELDL